MIRLARLVAMAVSALTPTGTIVGAQVQREFLRPAQAARMLADSRPWLVTRDDSRERRLTFNFAAAAGGPGACTGGAVDLQLKR